VPVTGALADRTSIPTALSISLVLAVAAAGLTASLPGKLFDLAKRQSRGITPGAATEAAA